MRRTLAVPLILLLSAAPAAGQAALADSHRAAALELVEALRMRETYQAGIDITLEGMIQGNPAMGQYLGLMREFMDEFLPWDRLREEYVRLYAAAFTEAELREMGSFYRTPVGVKLVRLTPALMQQASETANLMLMGHLPELERRIRERVGGF
jgi:uncharacterized protein